jgi:hypothetical protein
MKIPYEFMILLEFHNKSFKFKFAVEIGKPFTRRFAQIGHGNASGTGGKVQPNRRSPRATQRIEVFKEFLK